jgi:hypothetical protein
MAEILHAPTREDVLTTNVWAFLHWLLITRGIDLRDWAALQRFSIARADDFGAAIMAFARLPDRELALARHSGPQEALVLQSGASRRITLRRDDIRALTESTRAGGLRPDVAALLTRHWRPSQLIRPLAEILLHADVRPDDRLLVAGPPWPWLAALFEGASITLADPINLMEAAADARASILVAPAQTLSEAAFQRPGRRPSLGSLRTIIATGGPLSPEGRRRIYTWIKPDLMLLARTGDTLWGNPLEPVLAQPQAMPALLTRPASSPARPRIPPRSSSGSPPG